MVATRCPKFRSAIARCMATVDLPVPPFSLPTTITCAELERLALACIDMTRPYKRLTLKTQLGRLGMIEVDTSSDHSDTPVSPGQTIVENACAVPECDARPYPWPPPWCPRSRAPRLALFRRVSLK